MTGHRTACHCACFVLFIITAEALLSGLYIDNGVDQTVIHHSMTRDERIVVEHEILDLLGLGERPRRSRAPPLDRSAPSFLLDVYKQLAEEHEQARPTRSSEMALNGEEQQAIDESDLIMTFQSKKHHLGALRQGHGRHVWFEMAGAPDASSLLSAELRLHQGAARSDGPAELYTVVAHRVIDVDTKGGLQLERVAETNTSSGAEGWLAMNVTSALASWISAPADNRGFFLTVHPHSQPERHAKPEEIGLEEPRGALSEGKQPFVVAFFKGGPKLGNTDPGARRKREAGRRWRNQGYSDNYLRNPLTDTSHWTTRSCEIQTLYVSFKDLEWQDWIIAPDGYGAFYCSGECNFPLNAHKNATNHAIVQTLVHLLNPTQVPKPSCAPIKLSPISVLYYTDDSNVILRKYKNMVVKSCGCH